jgi:hypothetical protein
MQEDVAVFIISGTHREEYVFVCSCMPFSGYRKLPPVLARGEAATVAISILFGRRQPSQKQVKHRLMTPVRVIHAAATAVSFLLLR